MPDNFKDIAPATDPLASDVQQIIAALIGTNDVGDLALFAPIAAPGAPTVAAGTAGVLSGVYRYKICFCTGYVDDDGTRRMLGKTGGGTTATTASLTSKQVNLTNIPLGPAGTVARSIYRTASGGVDGTQKLVAVINDNTTTTYTHNLPDGSLGAAVPVSNTTGTKLTLANAAAQLLATFTPDQSVTPASGAQLLIPFLNMVAYVLKQIKGTTNWYDAGGAATAATANYLAQRDASGDLTARRLISTMATGTAPLDITSTTMVPNLNVDMIDGQHLATLGKNASGIVNTNTFTWSSGSMFKGYVNCGWAPKAVFVWNETPSGATYINMYLRLASDNKEYQVTGNAGTPQWITANVGDTTTIPVGLSIQLLDSTGFKWGWYNNTNGSHVNIQYLAIG